MKRAIIVVRIALICVSASVCVVMIVMADITRKNSGAKTYLRSINMVMKTSDAAEENQHPDKRSEKYFSTVKHDTHKVTKKIRRFAK